MADNVTKSDANKQADGEPRTVERKRKFVFDKCCFCCIPLQTGCLILAYMYLIVSILYTILTVVGLTYTISAFQHIPEDYRQLVIGHIALNAITLFLYLVAIVFNILLLVGLHKVKRNYVKIFVIFQLVYIILIVIQHIAMLNLITVGHLQSIISTLIIIVMNIYYLLVIRSHYIKMGENINNRVQREDRPVTVPTV